jgi:hypothetical protein
MRRFWKSACVVFLILASTSFRADAAILTVDGIFEEVREVQDGLSITLLVEEQRASGVLSPKCSYKIDDNPVSQEVFFEDALFQRISVDIDDKSGEVVACRLKILRLM